SHACASVSLCDIGIQARDPYVNNASRGRRACSGALFMRHVLVTPCAAGYIQAVLTGIHSVIAPFSRLAGLVAVVAAALPLAAQDTLPRRLPPVPVTRDAGRSPLDLPFAISSTRPDSLVPGLTETLREESRGAVCRITLATL